MIENKNNGFSNFKEIFVAYSAEESPIGWLSGFPIRKNLTTAELDFFIHPNGYVFTREWLDNDEYSGRLWGGGWAARRRLSTAQGPALLKT